MSQKEKNFSVVDAYVDTKTLSVESKHTRIFNADISYTNHKTGSVKVLTDTPIRVSYVVAFGCYAVSIAALQDVEGCFVEHSTSFNVFSFSNGQLTIKGKDNTGNKGDFTLVIA